MECSICLKNINAEDEQSDTEQSEQSDYYITNCKHHFHLSCLCTWINLNNEECPLCRKKLDKNNILFTQQKNITDNLHKLKGFTIKGMNIIVDLKSNWLDNIKNIITLVPKIYPSRYKVNYLKIDNMEVIFKTEKCKYKFVDDGEPGKKSFLVEFDDILYNNFTEYVQMLSKLYGSKKNINYLSKEYHSIKINVPQKINYNYMSQSNTNSFPMDESCIFINYKNLCDMNIDDVDDIYKEINKYNHGSFLFSHKIFEDLTLSTNKKELIFKLVQCNLN